jgi:recombinational DNA repair protein (RecF pathway)
MQLHSSKAIVLRSLALKEQQKILTLFSEQFGIISLVIKTRAKQSHCLTEPFCEGEFFFWPGSTDLKKYHEGSILDLHLGLRNQLSYLKTASSGKGYFILTDSRKSLFTYLRALQLFLKTNSSIFFTRNIARLFLFKNSQA